MRQSIVYEGRALRPRLLSASSSFSDISTSRRSAADEALHHGLAMMRSASVSSLDMMSIRSSSPAVPSFPQPSAKYHLKPGKTFIDYSVSAADTSIAMFPVSWSVQNTVVFGRGNRVHLKNFTTNEDITQLCKIRESHGDLRLLDCGGKDQPHVVASSTTKGYIQIWDVTTKKATMAWQTTGVVSMKWNGPVLTIGGPRGTIRHFDTRISQTAKMKEQTRKVTRHQAGISSLAWNGEGKLLASGDETGLVYCWDTRQNAPLDVGELVQRRRKMQHGGVITVGLLLAFRVTRDADASCRPWRGARGRTRCSPAATPRRITRALSASGMSAACRLFMRHLIG